VEPSKLRVAHIITQLELGGAQRNTLYTCGHLDTNRFEPILICGKGGILDEETKEASYPAHFLASLVRPVNPIKDLWAFFRLYGLCRRLRPHIVHTHSSKAGILGRAAAYLAGVPVVIHTFHGFGFTPGQRPIVRRLFTAVERWCAWMSTHLIFVSDDNRQEAVGLGIRGAAQGSLIRSGIAMRTKPGEAIRVDAHQNIRHELGIPADAWLIVSVGNFKPQKNSMDLARVAAEVLKFKPEARFVFVGDGEQRAEVEAWCQQNGIYAQTHFLGWRRDAHEILSAANSFLLTSLWEGLPRALVEAFSVELPAVAYAVNGVRDVLKDGENGFAIPPGEVAAAAEKLVYLMDHPADARRMGTLGRALVQEEFDIDRMVRQQEELYTTLYNAVPLKEYYADRWEPAVRKS
jgi:glycosyltransferase involved in cell wall biosynthesis